MDEEIYTDDDNFSVADSETVSVQEIPVPSNTVVVNNSSDVHIGDKTYLTIQHSIPTDSEVIKKIVNDVIVSSSIRTVLNVETSPEQLDFKSGPCIKSLECFKEESPNLTHHVNGTTTFTVEEKNTTVNPLLKSSFNLCGYPFTFKLCSVLTVVMVSMAFGFSFAIWKLTDDNRLTPTPTSPYFTSTSRPRLPAPLIYTNGNGNGSSTPSPTSSMPQPNGWYIRTRRDWNAWEKEKTIEWLQLPVKNVVIAHTAGGICLTEVVCCDKMRGIQEWVVVKRGLEDIPYNFLVGGDGNVYEGLGWDIKGYNAERYDSVSICVSFIGNFVRNHPTQQQLEAAKRLLAWGVEIGKLDPDYRLLPHNLTKATVSPGPFIYQEIKTWPHFTEERFHIPS